MCGIFGAFNIDPSRPADLQTLRRMGEVLAHRGPDGGGLHTDGALGIGMRRLSIIDLKTGNQPLANEDGSIWVVFKTPWTRAHLDRRALAEYFKYEYLPDPTSIVECVAKLPPEHTLTVQDGRAGVPRRYWEVTACFRNAGVPPSEEDASERLWT